MNEKIYIPFTIDDIEKLITILVDYLRFYDLEDFIPVIDRDEVEDFQEWFLEARQKSFMEEEIEDGFE